MRPGIWRRYMDGRPTDNDGREAVYEVQRSAEASDTAAVLRHIRPCSDIDRFLFIAWETRLSFLKSTGATWKKPNRKEGKSAFLIIRNQQLFLLKMSETVQKRKGSIVLLIRFCEF
jgi:hypothetical protein